MSVVIVLTIVIVGSTETVVTTGDNRDSSNFGDRSDDYDSSD